jgi:hypothetical protein
VFESLQDICPVTYQVSKSRCIPEVSESIRGIHDLSNIHITCTLLGSRSFCYGVAIELELDCVRVRLPQVFHPEADARESWMHNEGEENGEAGGTHLKTNAHLCMYLREAQ